MIPLHGLSYSSVKRMRNTHPVQFAQNQCSFAKPIQLDLIHHQSRNALVILVYELNRLVLHDSARTVDWSASYCGD